MTKKDERIDRRIYVVERKEYVTITKESAEKIRNLKPYTLGAFLRVVLSAGEAGETTAKKALQDYPISAAKKEAELDLLEAAGLIRRDGETITVLNWDQYNL